MMANDAGDRAQDAENVINPHQFVYKTFVAEPLIVGDEPVSAHRLPTDDALPLLPQTVMMPFLAIIDEPARGQQAVHKDGVAGNQEDVTQTNQNKVTFDGTIDFFAERENGDG